MCPDTIPMAIGFRRRLALHLLAAGICSSLLAGISMTLIQADRLETLLTDRAAMEATILLPILDQQDQIAASNGLNDFLGRFPSVSRDIFVWGALLCVNVNDCAALDLSVEHPANDSGHLRQADYLRGTGKLAQVQILRQTRPRLNADLLRSIDRIDAGKGHIAQNEGQDRSWKIHPLRQAAGRDHAAILGSRQYVGQRMTADGIHRSSPSFTRDRRPRLGKSPTVDDLRRAEAV